jgi:hypothetical protein
VKLTNYDLTSYVGVNIDLLTFTIYSSIFLGVILAVSLILFILFIPKSFVVRTMSKKEATEFMGSKLFRIDHQKVFLY